MREWYYAKQDKRGRGRSELEVRESFVPLCVGSWPGGPQGKAAGAGDGATQLKDRLAVLVVSVVYRGRAIPIAWRVLPKTEKGSWNSWLDLFSAFQGVIPDDWTVIVLADRGLYASWLFEPSSSAIGIPICGSIARCCSVRRMNRNSGPCIRRSGKPDVGG